MTCLVFSCLERKTRFSGPQIKKIYTSVQEKRRTKAWSEYLIALSIPYYTTFTAHDTCFAQTVDPVWCHVFFCQKTWASKIALTLIYFIMLRCITYLRETCSLNRICTRKSCHRPILHQSLQNLTWSGDEKNFKFTGWR